MVKHELKKITHYEFWEFWIFYAPMIPIWLYFSIKSKSLTYFTATNPGLEYGGFFYYSKFKIQKQIDAEKRPKHHLIDLNSKTTLPPFDFPFIAKPDKGERGKNVQLISSFTSWNRYIDNKSENIITQEYIDFPAEFGVFYAKLPNEKKGRILSITGKKYLTFYGDGKTSLREFIESESRAYFNKSYLYMKYNDKQDLILPAGESMILEPIGNHNRGTYFYDKSELITPSLVDAVEKSVHNIEGFYYGRLDLKAKSEKALQNGEFKILEINGANAEPSHIYDENYSILKAYKEVYRHLNIQYKIAKHNIENDCKSTPILEFTKKLIKYLTH